MRTHTNPELEARILDSPDDLSAYLVYSDWLSERGDPRGELIAVQAKLVESPNDDVLRLTEAKLLADHASEWLGALFEKDAKDLELGWRLGFLDSVRFGSIDDYETSEGIPDGLATLIELPGSAFVRNLVIGSIEYDDYPTSWQPCIDILVEKGVPKGLARLELNCGSMWDISSTELGAIEALYPKLGKLRTLKIHMGAMDLGTIDLPALRDLEIVTGGLTKLNLEAIGAATFPDLERLSLFIGEENNGYNCDVGLADIESFLGRGNTPRLRHLALGNYNQADKLPELVLESKLLAQLESLDFSLGTFGDEGARYILDHAAAFKHLKKIDLTHNYLSEPVMAALEKLGPEVVLADREIASGPDERYVQISE